MPNEAKFSPLFHEVSPATVPPHSFCQTLRPMRIASARERLIALATGTKSNSAVATPTAAHLDGPVFPDSMQPSAALGVASSSLLILMKNICILLTGILLATTAFAQNTQLKDEKDKVSYSIGLDIGNTFKKQYMDI